MQWWCAAQGVPWSWEWQAYPGVWLFVLLLVGLHRRLRRRFPETDRPRFRAWMFGLGVFSLWIALDWPVGALGAGYLASVHMVQYLLIALVAPPLLLAGLPRGLYAALAGSRLKGPLRVVSHPIAALGIFVGVMAWTHWPPVVDTLMVSQAGSFLLDLLWLLSGLVFWWPVVAPVPERSWLQDPGKVGYLIVATLVNTGVFAYLTFSPLPLYSTYELAPPVTGLSTRDDQLLAGLLMKMGGAVILWTAITIIFFRWVARSESEGRGLRGAAGMVAILVVTACGSGAEDPPDRSWRSVGPVEVATVVVGAPPTPDRAALYFRIRNLGEAPVTLAGVRVEGVDRAELHRTSLDAGMMRMTPTGPVVVAPGEELVLRPGGLHVMLSGIWEALEVGDSVLVRLLLDDGSAQGPVSGRVVPLQELEDRLGAEEG